LADRIISFSVQYMRIAGSWGVAEKQSWKNLGFLEKKFLGY